jgi:site-specific DNA-methyltransferase (adenine-specific)
MSAGAPMTEHRIIQGDVLEGLRTLPDGCVHCTVTSPPYDQARTYEQEKISWDFQKTAKELHRVTCQGGIVCWNVNDTIVNGSESLTHARQAIYFVDSCGFNLHDTMIYKKSNFSHPEKVRYHQAFEYILILSKGSPRTFNPIKDKKNATAGCVGNLGINTFTERDGSKSVRPKKVTAEYGMRLNVWEGNTRGQEDMCIELKHPAMMPKWLARDLILSWSNPSDIILDPFAGSGTTALMAESVNRASISIEINPNYIQQIQASFGLVPYHFDTIPQASEATGMREV